MSFLKLLYILCLATLFYVYWLALSRLRDRRLPLSPILGWMVGLGYFTLAPLTILVLNGGYTIPEIIGANERYASVDLANTTYFLPMTVIWLALLLSFLSVGAKAGTDEGRERGRVSMVECSKAQADIVSHLGAVTS
jgi:hypothetical protein